jgi:DUF2075 family protein
MTLNLNTELRFHFCAELHGFVAHLLEDAAKPLAAQSVAEPIRTDGEYDLGGLRLWATRDLALAKDYLRRRYSEQPDARYGLLASSRDKLLHEYGIDNTWQGTQAVRLGPWYSDGEESPASCRKLEKCVTEFGAQGLELDMALVGWGSDLRRDGGKWDNSRARRYAPGQVELHDGFQLRLNAYRVLLTRGRDGTIVFVPPTREMDETWAFLLERGFRNLGS